MSSILVFVQQTNGKPLKASLSALTAAHALAGIWKIAEINAVCVGEQSEQCAQVLSTYGVTQVYWCADAALEKYRAVPYADIVRHAAKDCDTSVIVAAATSAGKDFMPRLAAQLEAGQASDIIAINVDGSLKRPMFAGNVFADVEVTTAIKCVTVRATAFPPASPVSGSGRVSQLTCPPVDVTLAGDVIGSQISASTRPDLGEAGVVVSGGRALQSSENFQKYIFPLADALGAAVGASRAAVDSGYAPNDWQVGQTGKVVAPNLYVAVGISGAIQHLAGMKDSKVIVAINKDGEAPIFEVADYGLVGDLFQLVPELTELLKKAKGV